MPKSKPDPQLLSGSCQQLLFSPRGGLEGVLLKVDRKTVQVSWPPHVGPAMSRRAAPGKRLRLLATADRSPKAAGAPHPVYAFEALADTTGRAIEWPVDGDGSTSMKGKVARIHYAKHGEPNGVVLETGEFIHLRPHGMSAIGLDVGAKVSARGELRMTVLGTRMLEARHANGYDID